MKTLIENLSENKKLQKGIGNVNYYSTERFLKDALQYVKAIKERRMICTIPSVSASGMSRIIKFNSCEKSKNGYWYSNYYAFFKALGYTPVKHDGFRVNGCGMDMVFDTNYSIMHELKNLGIITKANCEKLAQMTPTVL